MAEDLKLSKKVETCENCRFRSKGECRRFPPTKSGYVPSEFPMITCDTWCGEWRGRKHPIEWEALSARLRNTLQYGLSKIPAETFEDLAEHKATDLIRIRNFGITCLRELRYRLAEYGLRLKGE